MQNIPQYSPADFPVTWSELVSDAAMYLPALVRPQDEKFILVVTDLVIRAFWEDYIGQTSDDEQKLFAELVDQKNEQAVLQWFEKHANFKNDPIAEENGRKILLDIAAHLPAFMKHEYEEFSLASSPTAS